ncbi:hypothetical protein JHK82_016345 [Glycine max]|nr:hypothetical protein JHK82_016345 [Glycine max]
MAIANSTKPLSNRGAYAQMVELKPKVAKKGLLPPLDAPHHLRKHEWGPYREAQSQKQKPLSPSPQRPVTVVSSTPLSSLGFVTVVGVREHYVTIIAYERYLGSPASKQAETQGHDHSASFDLAQSFVFAMCSCVDRISVFCAPTLAILQLIVNLRILVVLLTALFTRTKISLAEDIWDRYGFDFGTDFSGLYRVFSHINYNVCVAAAKALAAALDEHVDSIQINVSRLGAIVIILKDTSHYHSSKFADPDITLSESASFMANRNDFSWYTFVSRFSLLNLPVLFAPIMQPFIFLIPTLDSRLSCFPLLYHVLTGLCM